MPANSTPEPRRCVECLPDVRCHPTPVTLCLYPVSTIYLYTVQSVGSIYSLYTGQSAGCRPIKGLMRQGSGLQDPAPALESICQRTHLQPSFGCRELGIIIYIAGYKLSAEGTGQWSVSRLEWRHAPLLRVISSSQTAARTNLCSYTTHWPRLCTL